MEDQGAITSPQADPELGQSATEAAKPVEATPPVEAAQPVAKDPEVEASFDPTKIPTKFVGKTSEEIIKSYSELEKEKGRLANKVNEAEKARKELEAKLFSVQQPQTQVPQNQVVSSQQIKSIDDLYAEEWEVDPKQAVINRDHRRDQQRSIEQNGAQASTFYSQAMTGKLPGFEDFPDLEPTMKQLVPYVSDLVDPKMINHPKTMQVLHMIARGVNVDKAAEQKAKHLAAKEREKREAFSESSSGGGSDVTDFASMSIPDMRKYLGYAKRT